MTPFGDTFSIISISWIILIVYWVISAFFVKKSIIRKDPKWMIFRFIVLIAIILIIEFNKTNTVYFSTFLFQSAFSFVILGSILTVVGLFGAIWARIYLGRNWSGYVTYKENHGLVTDGPYKFVRHPIYTSLILMFIGTILYYGSLFVFIIFIIMTSIFIWRIKREEKIMINLFGKKYLDYMKRTKKLIPLIY